MNPTLILKITFEKHFLWLQIKKLFFVTLTDTKVEQSEKKCNTKKPNCNHTRAFWWCWIKMGVWKKIRGYRKFTTLFIARSIFLSGLLMQMKFGRDSRWNPNQRGKVTIVYRTDASFGGQTIPTVWGDDFFGRLSNVWETLEPWEHL